MNAEVNRLRGSLYGSRGSGVMVILMETGASDWTGSRFLSRILPSLLR